MDKQVLISQEMIKKIFIKRSPGSHKGDHGHSLIIAGSAGKMGAAIIAARACLRAGTGLLTVLTPKKERAIIQISVPEAMVEFRGGKTVFTKFTAAGIGPGMGIKNSSSIILKSVINHFRDANLVLDADSLTILSNHKKCWHNIAEGTILTPHPGEFDRMFGKHSTKEERINTAVQISCDYGWILVLKDQHTAVILKNDIYINTTGNQGLAKGGSGDALTGIITAFLAEGYTALESAQLAVYFHGLSADMALSNQSYESLLISDVIESIGKAFKTIEPHYKK